VLRDSVGQIDLKSQFVKKVTTWGHARRVVPRFCFFFFSKISRGTLKIT
jgi:hypothetical protein